MDLSPLIVDFKLNTLSKTYYVSGDAPVNYLWTVFFKIDGDTVSVGPLGQVQGTATVVGTPGDHGDIFDDGNEGVRAIPASSRLPKSFASGPFPSIPLRRHCPARHQFRPLWDASLSFSNRTIPPIAQWPPGTQL